MWCKHHSQQSFNNEALRHRAIFHLCFSKLFALNRNYFQEGIEAASDKATTDNALIVDACRTVRIKRLQKSRAIQNILDMPHKIFLSHNFNDKPIVETVALRLAEIFGQEQVFYDSWSIKPGDGIIDQMNNGLEAPEFVFFFVSAASLASAMVKLEWQNALYAASKGKTRIIPVRIDGSNVPPILGQTLYIDMHSIGLEAALAQIVSVTQGHASYTPQHRGFSNLSYKQKLNSSGIIEVTISASHLMEPNPNFSFISTCDESEIQCELKGKQPWVGGFAKGFVLHGNGSLANGILMRPMGGALTPSHPFRALFTPKTKKPIQILAVFHQKGENDWIELPRLLEMPTP